MIKLMIMIMMRMRMRMKIMMIMMEIVVIMVMQEGKQTSTGQQPLSLLLEVVPFFSIAFQIRLPLLLYVGLISGQEGLWRCRSGEGM